MSMFELSQLTQIFGLDVKIMFIAKMILCQCFYVCTSMYRNYGEHLYEFAGLCVVCGLEPCFKQS